MALNHSLHLEIYHFSGRAETGALPSLFQWVNPKGFLSPVLKLCWTDPPTPVRLWWLRLQPQGQSFGHSHGSHAAPTNSQPGVQPWAPGPTTGLTPPQPWDKCKLFFIQGLKPLCVLQKETPAIDYKENWDRPCIRMALGGRRNGLLLVHLQSGKFRWVTGNPA